MSENMTALVVVIVFVGTAAVLVLRSDDGGVNWVNEQSTPSLAGFAFYQIAVDPADKDHCVAATTNGLYERVPSGATFTWERRRTGAKGSLCSRYPSVSSPPSSPRACS